MKPLKFIQKGMNILTSRLREQGLRTTLIWMYGRGLPKLTGIPLMRYSQVTPQLYVGPQYGKSGKRKLEQLGINNNVNMRIEFDDSEHGLSLKNYCYLPTVDDDAPTIEHLLEGVAFIREVIDSGEQVYIHCAGGIGRAPTMAAAYLISEGLTLQAAIAKIKKVRPFINIMPAQLEQLKRFEQMQLNQSD